MTGCELNQIFLGEIAAVQNYGAFVRIPGCAQQGLIHKSQVSSSHVDDVGEVLQRGERVWCKVISINEEGKISLSMKLVNQGNGTDLDPTGVQLQKDDQKRKTFVSGQRKIIQLQAVLNTTCGKCGTHGHLSTDCFMSPDGKTYELLPEVEDEVEENGEKGQSIKTGITSIADPLPKVKKHKSKKSKHKKKSKKSKSTDESGSSDSQSEEKFDSGIKKSAKKKARMKRKDKKKRDKKKSRENSSQSHSTDDNDDNDKDNEATKHSLKRKSSEHQGRERRTKKCKYSSSKR